MSDERRLRSNVLISYENTRGCLQAERLEGHFWSGHQND